jgi:hypothetical protein
VIRASGGSRSTASAFDPEDPDARLYATFFCRNCGPEDHPIVLVEEGGPTRMLPRPIDETPIDPTGQAAGFGIDSVKNLSIFVSFEWFVFPIVSPGVKLR